MKIGRYCLDAPIVIAVAAVSLLGLLLHLSIPDYPQPRYDYLQRYASQLGLGLLVASMVTTISPESLRKLSWPLFGVSILLLALVLVFGEETLGAKRWLRLGPLSLQPSELAKLTTILALAELYSRIPPTDFLRIIASGLAVIGLPSFLIFLQPDLGTAIALVGIFLIVSYSAGTSLTQILVLLSPVLVPVTSALGPMAFEVSWRDIQIGYSWLGLAALLIFFGYLAVHYQVPRSRPRLAGLLGLGVLLLLLGSVGRPLAWDMLKPYQQQRIKVFLNPYSDPREAGYNLLQSLRAVGGGQLVGQGYGRGTLTQGQHVPEQHTDFVFSALSEELGFLGATGAVACFFVICWRFLQLAFSYKPGFERYVSVGCLGLFGFHVFVNIGMNIGLLPITGAPLPFLSYGGSFMWLCLICLGIHNRLFHDREHSRLLS